MSRARALLWPGIATLIAGAVLLALGLWQLHRLSWKEGILAEIAARIHAAPAPLPVPSTWPTLKPADYEYRRVTFSGTFDHAKETLVFRSMEAGPGYLVMTPLEMDGGGTVIVNRGYVPLERKDRAMRLAGDTSGHVIVTGLMREPEQRNLFTPADDLVKDQFFTRDPVVIAAHDGLRNVAPFTVDADSTANPGGWPQGGTTAIDIPNNHFSYALTWFGLALGLICVFGSYAIKQLKSDVSELAAEHHRSPADVKS